MEFFGAIFFPAIVAAVIGWYALRAFISGRMSALQSDDVNNDPQPAGQPDEAGQSVQLAQPESSHSMR